MTNNYQELIAEYINKVKARSQHFLGYPVATDFDYQELLELLKYPLNNLGDPLIESTYDINSRSIEREVVDFFADIFEAPVDNRWGYVTNGGSEGNLYALYVARELYPNAMVYYSEATHYSIQKNIHLLNMPSIVVCASANGEIDYDDLQENIRLHRHQPVIIIANIGTTMTEAKDDISKIREVLKKSAIKNYYLHCDAALAGVYSALLKLEPKFSFVEGADSVAISGHKFIGSPIPCGVVVVKKSYKERIGRIIPYIGTSDTTITGSRNGHSPILLWYAIKKYGIEGLSKRGEESLQVAAFAEEELNKIGIKAWRNHDAITVVFPQPKKEICLKWQLASDNGHSHIICMPGVTFAKINEFVADMANNDNNQ
jgi:histidine decarboxylase